MPSEYILIGADLVPTKSNIDIFQAGDVNGLVGEELGAILKEASYRIFNLEVPLTDKEDPILKQGPNLIASTKCVVGYKALGVDLLTLANNHILDQGEHGLETTIEVLNEAGINHVGAGKKLEEASEPFIFSFAGKKVGVYACAEHEFSIAGENTPGANPFDPLWALDHVEELKKKVDFVIVLYHGGKELYRYPSPGLQKTCRRLVDKGADLVICQHSHCIGCEEKYKGGTIVYGQGNFLFDNSNNECWQTSLLLKLDEDMRIEYIPLIKAENSVKMAGGEDATEILRDFNNRTEEIKKPNFIENQYQRFADSFLLFYLRALSGKHSLLYRVFNKVSNGMYSKWHLKNAYQKKSNVRIVNYMDCEAHRELLLQALNNRLIKRNYD